MSDREEPKPQESNPTAGYTDEDLPLGSYATLSSVFWAAFGTGLYAAYRRRGGLPDQPTLLDVLTAGAATHKLSRLIAKDKVTSFVRAPFVRYQEPAGRGEVSETPRGEGLQHAAGELLNCPYCLSQWVAGAIVIGYVRAPRLTRLLTFQYSAQTVADFMQIAYKAAGETLDD